MKKVILCLCLVLTLGCLANAQNALLSDQAGLLDSWEAADLQEELEQILEETEVAVVIVTVDGLSGESIEACAEDWFDNGGYGDDGILLLVDMDSRQWHISTTGYGMEAVSDRRVDVIGERMESDLSDGNYYGAFCTFAEECLDHIEQAQNGTPYDDSEDSNLFKTLVICVLIGFGISLIVVLCMKGQLKSVRFKPDAQSYVVPGSMQVTQSHDMYLYSSTVRTARPKSNSSGGSSGRSHGGGGGRF